MHITKDGRRVVDKAQDNGGVEGGEVPQYKYYESFLRYSQTDSWLLDRYSSISKNHQRRTELNNSIIFFF